MNKGKVIDIQKKYVVVMNDQMAYEKIEKKNGLSLGKEIYYFEEDLYKESKQPVKKYFLVAAVLFMMLFIQPLLVAEEAYGYISVDINPSIELQVNKDLDVLSIEAINEDAKGYMKEEWIGKSAKEVIDLIIEETRSKGVLNNERDFVLVSYYFNDEDPTSEEVFVQSLDELFNEKSHDYEVAVIKSDAETYSEAKEAKESLGKQVVIKKMNTKVDDLLAAKASIEEDEDFKIYKKDVNEKSEDNEKDNPSKGVLERRTAEAIAFKTIGGKGKILDFDFDRGDGEVEYTFEIVLEDQIHKVKINGFAGEVTEYEVESYKNKDDKDQDNEKSKPSKGVIGRKSAETIAFERIGDAGKILEFDFERDGDEAEYEFEIAADSKRYKINIDGFTGEVIKYEVDIDDNDDSDDEESQSSRGVLGRKAAETLIFEAIGGEGKIIDYDFNRDDDEAEYEFEVELDGEIHKIKIDGFIGEVIEHEVDEQDEDDSDEKNNDDSSEDIMSRKTAESIAFDTIGGEGKIIDYNFDRDDDEAEYEFEVELDGEIHKIKIDGFIGEVIEHEVDEQDEDDSDEKNNDDSSEDIMSRKTAESIAFDTIGGEGKINEYDFNRDDDEAEYEFVVELDGKSHKIKIDGFTGEVFEHEVDQQDEDLDEDDLDKNHIPKDVIGRKASEAIVIKTIGGVGMIIKYDFDRDDDEAEYSFEVALEGKIHEIKIDGFTGDVLEHEVDEQDEDSDDNDND